MSDTAQTRSHPSHADGGGGRPMHPCLPAFAIWLILVVLPIATAVMTGSPAWILLSVPPLASLALLGQRIGRGRPLRDDEQTERLDQMLIDVGGEDAFGVVAQNQIDMPVALRRTQRPLIIAASDFLTETGEDVLRGIAALQHAELRDEAAIRRAKLMKVVRPVLIFIIAFGASVLSGPSAGPIGGFATLGFSLWLIGVVVTVWFSRKRMIRLHARSDLDAAGLAGNPRLVADALLAMKDWRDAHRTRYSLLERVAHRIGQPIRPNWHEAERATILLAQQT